jgi:hypothetical protein
MAALVTEAASVPSLVRLQVAAGPGEGAGIGPEARQKMTSPSTGVKAGFTARATPALAMRKDRAATLIERGVGAHAHKCGARTGGRREIGWIGETADQLGGGPELAALVSRRAEQGAVRRDYVAERIGDGDRADRDPGRQRRGAPDSASTRPLTAE